jgi:hypothetical protein
MSYEKRCPESGTMRPSGGYVSLGAFYVVALFEPFWGKLPLRGKEKIGRLVF